MKKNAMWMVPGILALSAIWWMPGCTSDDPAVVDDGQGNGDAGGSKSDGGNTTADSSTVDSGSTDASNDADAANGNDADSGEAGATDPYIAACARIDACATATGARIGMNGCYELLTAAPFDLNLDARDRAKLENLKCKLAATTCTAVQACDKPKADYVALCAQQEGGEHCDGNVHVVCDDNTFEPVIAVNCAATGDICGKADFSAGCGVQTCDQADFTKTCAGDKLTICNSAGVTQEVDCKVRNTTVSVKPAGRFTIGGTTCGIDNKDFVGQNNCIGTGAACTSFAQKCDGTVLETCAGGFVARRDCATVLPAGQGCTVLEDGPMAGAYGCGPVNPSCHETDDETCNTATGVIGFCGLTSAKSVDCKALGYAGCKTTTVDGRVTAACFQ
jgi:hypothetical protein